MEGLAAMQIEESNHYSISSLDALEEWASNAPQGFGYLRLGPERRAFAIDMMHQLHCLRRMRVGLAGDYRNETQWHIQHCLNFLRQMILCSPNLTLEPADVLDRNFTVRRTGSVHVCLKAERYYDAMAVNWRNFIGHIHE